MSSRSHRKKYVGWTLGLAAFLSLALLGRWYHVRLRELREGSRQCLEVHKTFLTALRQGDHKKAYELMSLEYRSGHALDSFKADPLVRHEERGANEDWRPGERSVGRIWIGQQNSEGWLVGTWYEYVREAGQWRLTGKTQFYVD
ncbi:MAG: hypothetical protein AMJ81_11550 [Phycisphaerae bacterium SM23_33]|jgi:hypothetical protein|nr:MAG: hypothetical protein AMJ81_11550 [Phycisphaerae bacterium SM23_33]